MTKLRGERCSGALRVQRHESQALTESASHVTAMAATTQKTRSIVSPCNGGRLNHHLLLPAAARDNYLPRVLQPSHHVHDLLLGGFDIADAHGAHVLHVLLDELSRALGH